MIEVDVGVGIVQVSVDDGSTVRGLSIGVGNVVVSLANEGPQGPIGATGQVPSARTIGTSAPLAGGGDLSTNRTLSLNIGGNLEVVANALKVKDALVGIDSIDFDTTAGVTPIEGRLSWNATDGTLNLGLKGGNVVLQVGQEQVQLIKAQDNGGLPEGKAVYVTGSDGANITGLLAKADTAATSSRTIGVMTEAAVGGAKGYMTTFGLVRSIDTHLLTEGGIVYLSPSVAGDLTTTVPISPNHRVVIGWCVRSHATQGAIFVSVNDGLELGDLHNVLITNPQHGDTIRYDAVSGVWKNAP